MVPCSDYATQPYEKSACTWSEAMWPNTVLDTRHRGRPAARAASTAAIVASDTTTWGSANCGLSVRLEATIGSDAHNCQESVHG